MPRLSRSRTGKVAPGEQPGAPTGAMKPFFTAPAAHHESPSPDGRRI